LAHRCAQLEKIHAALGNFMNIGELQPWNALRGKWQIQAERGVFEVLVTLAPTLPPKIQMLILTLLKPES